jgi:hypothetical protein
VAALAGRRRGDVHAPAGSGSIVEGSVIEELIRNSKFEIRNPKQIQNPKEKAQNEEAATSCFEFAASSFGFVSDFVFRISDFPQRGC